MAQLRSPMTDSRHAPTPASINWPMPREDVDLDEAVEEKGCIELHGCAYLAFCKAWGPLFVAPEECEAD